MKKETERLSAEFLECVKIDAIPSINDIEKAAHHMLALQSRIEALEKDAARYRWLRSGDRTIPEIKRLHIDSYFEDELDEVIDHAMQSEKGGV